MHVKIPEAFLHLPSLSANRVLKKYIAPKTRSALFTAILAKFANRGKNAMADIKTESGGFTIQSGDTRRSRGISCAESHRDSDVFPYTAFLQKTAIPKVFTTTNFK